MLNRTVLFYIFFFLAIALVIAFLFKQYALWQYNVLEPDVTVTISPISRSEAVEKYGMSTLPQTASNVFYAQSSVGMGGRLRIFRFDASQKDCFSYAQTIMEGNIISNHISPGSLESSHFPALHEAFERFGLRDAITWFNIKEVTNGVILRGSISQKWILIDYNGRLYYCHSD